MNSGTALKVPEEGHGLDKLFSLVLKVCVCYFVTKCSCFASMTGICNWSVQLFPIPEKGVVILISQTGQVNSNLEGKGGGIFKQSTRVGYTRSAEVVIVHYSIVRPNWWKKNPVFSTQMNYSVQDNISTDMARQGWLKSFIPLKEVSKGSGCHANYKNIKNKQIMWMRKWTE